MEVTERARKLRAQYALQAQSLRTRIELRVNRIPTALRRANMGEVFAKHEEMPQHEQNQNNADARRIRDPQLFESKPKSIQNFPPSISEPAPKAKGEKRDRYALVTSLTRSTLTYCSDSMESGGKDQITIHEDPIPNPKKRTKVTRNPNSRRAPIPSTVLSPKSANSRTHPQSPVQPALGSPQKPINLRPASPLKTTSSPTKASTEAVATAIASMILQKQKPGRPKASVAKSATTKSKKVQERAQESEPLRMVSSTSSSSAMSTGTTIVKNTKKTPTATAKRNLGAKTGVRKVAGPAEAPSIGRRVLRKRA